MSTTDGFHPLVQEWFQEKFGEPTEPQRLGWPLIAQDENVLIAAPTGSGKTLAAFLVCLDRLWRDWLAGRLPIGIQVVYVSPLKALSNDIERNLRVPLAGISALAVEQGFDPPPIRIALRTGDTPASERQAMLRKPPHILVTTPESLYLLLTSPRSRELLRGTRTVIVDEIHALARDKRGSHLSLSLERLSALCDRPPARIGLSATQRPIEGIARFLAGSGCEFLLPVSAGGTAESTSFSVDVNAPTDRALSESRIHIVDSGHVRELDLAIETPDSELSAVCSHEQWTEIYQRLVELIEAHRSTLIFVNTRRLAERVSHRLREFLGEESVAGHHGSLSRTIRLDVEQRLKDGKLKAIVATASLEMGIDIGYIDLVCQLGSPRSIATFLQRVGRSGHSLGMVPQGRLFPFTRDELLECVALVRAVRRGKLDQIEIPEAPLDILAQQIVAMAACEDWHEQQLLELVRRAWPYRNLSDANFESVLEILSEGIARNARQGAYLHRDRINHKLRARRSARLAAITSGGAIPETAEYRVIAQPEETFVGTVDEDFAIESVAGDIFLLGNTSWRVMYVRGGQVVVRDADGAPPSIPFWFGEAPGRTVELSEEISTLREELVEQISAAHESAEEETTICEWLRADAGIGAKAAEQAATYVRTQLEAVGMVPTRRTILFERFFDESGGMQLVIHSPLGARINRAWGFALRKRFCRSFDFELQAAATDNGILLSIGPQHSFPIESLFKMLGPHNAEHLLSQALLAAPMFQVRWRWNVTRALAVLRTQGGKKVPPYLQRYRSDDLLAAVFPQTVGCLENHHGDIEIPNHPLVRQTMHDCLTEAMDVQRWIEVLTEITEEKVQLVAIDTREPSPFCYELLNANPYAFLDDAPLEERRTRAVSTRRSYGPEELRDLARLDPAAIEQVRSEAWPLVRDADELHDALVNMVILSKAAAPAWSPWMDELADGRRAARVRIDGLPEFWMAAERWPMVRAIYSDAKANPSIDLPAELDRDVQRADAVVELVRGFVHYSGPTSAEQIGRAIGLETESVTAALTALEGHGMVMRGHFNSQPHSGSAANNGDAKPLEWCDRRLLARIHRLTLQGLRNRIKPVEPVDFIRFLTRHHHLLPGSQRSGRAGVREAISQLEGFDMPAGTWETAILPARIQEYDQQWLDELFLSGEIAWGRLRNGQRDDAKKVAAITRMVPISLMLRSDLPWLARREASSDERLSSQAREVVDALRSHGALFFQEMAAITGLLPTHLENALRELAGTGLVTSDAFSAIRLMVSRRRNARNRITGSASAMGIHSGRWSRFPAQLGVPESPEKQAENWCRLLLRRYGIVFHDLLTRDAASPPWRYLVPILRRMELRGEVRGGRFVSGVAGEQFAEESVVEAIRSVRDAKNDDPWIVISAADPVNLTGIITPEERISATHKNALILQNGRCVAAKHLNHVEFFVDVDPPAMAEMRRSLQTGRRESESHIREAWIERHFPRSTSQKSLSALPSRTIRRH